MSKKKPQKKAALEGETPPAAHLEFLLDVMLCHSCDKVWVNDKGEVFVEENLANLSVKQQKEKLKVYTKSLLESLKVN